MVKKNVDKACYIVQNTSEVGTFLCLHIWKFNFQPLSM